jgi:lysophospholipase L1-like esterase
MSKRVVRWLLLIVVGMGLFFIWHRSKSSANYANFPPRAGTVWVAFGDSLTSGYGADEGKDYPTVLGQRLGVKIENHGTSGETSQDGLNRVEEIVRLNPRVVLLCLGGNDGLRQMSARQMFANLGAIIDRLHEAGAFVVLIGVRSASLFDKNETGFKKLAQEKQLLYVPNILEGLLTDPRLMSDSIHPNEQGYEAIADRLEKVLRPLLPRLLP